MRKLYSAPWVTSLLLAGVGVATVLAFLASLGWPYELFVHFRVQYAVVALLLAGVLAWRQRPVAAALAVCVLLGNAVPIAQRLQDGEAAADCGGPDFGVATINLQYTNDRHTPLLQWLDRQSLDFVVFQEVTEAWVGALATLADYPHRYVVSRADPYGIGVLSRWPLESVRAVDFAADGLPSIHGTIAMQGRRIEFVALHSHWPILPGLARSRDRALQRAALLVRDAQRPVVLLGDLNVSPYSPAFRRLLRESGLRDTGGARWSPTWQAGFWPLALRIDHILVSPEFCVGRVAVGPPIGSDHRPVAAQLRLPR